MYNPRSKVRILNKYFRHKHTLIALQNLANVYRINNELDTAVKLLKELAEFKESEENPSQIDIINVKNDLVGALRELGKYEEAERIINQ